ncbi:membrane protein [Desulfosporosinus sp. HMP52]|uniref:DUF445 domain-containing protein n=1 Tax=Desulfosporosinus sp. HMP52 TaxID=1487923 RepID=UPI00051FC968|nr:DUF445 domain-containing protein [Desulfosporosinus sp. HMP52]KGK85035.1 membrane protein [Desulfosporosinus sp. HMP52]
MNYHKKANLTLATVFILFITAAVIQHYNPNDLKIRLVNFVLEAALVGGIADWFAVTAIFQKPLGWGFHTALIPRNREKVIEAVASMVQSELLRMDLIRQKIEKLPFMDSLIKYLDRQGGSEYLAEKLTPYLQGYLEKQAPDQLAKRLTAYLQANAQAWNLAVRLQDGSRWALNKGYMDQILDQIAEGLWDKASQVETRQIIVKYLEKIKQEKVSNGGAIFRTLLGFVEMSDGLNLDEAADALQVELLLTLRRLKDHNNPLRLSLKDKLMEEIELLAKDPEFFTWVDTWKESVLADPLTERFLETVISTAIKSAIIPSKTMEPTVLEHLLKHYMAKIWYNLQNDQAFCQEANSFLVDILCRVIYNEHHVIGNMVRETLAEYTDQDLNQFVQDKAGNDLQWIRINGSMIGGFVGLILFLFLEFIYNPFVMPALMNYIPHIY